MIADGHHRYAASKLSGVDIGVTEGVVDPDIRAEAPADWSEVRIDNVDWDDPAQMNQVFPGEEDP